MFSRRGNRDVLLVQNVGFFLLGRGVVFHTGGGMGEQLQGAGAGGSSKPRNVLAANLTAYSLQPNRLLRQPGTTR